MTEIEWKQKSGWSRSVGPLNAYEYNAVIQIS